MIIMKLINRLLVVFFVGILTFGCSSKGKTDTNTVSNAPQKPKNFERVRPPVIMTNPQDQAGYIITHFWDKFAFTDTMYCHAPEITEQAFLDFIILFPYAKNEKVFEGVKKLLDSSEVEEVMYNYFCSLADRILYNPNSRYRSDEFYIPFLEHVVESKKINELSKIRSQQMLQLAYRNRIGSKAENFVYTTETGSSGRLHNISAPKVLLMFYNPECKECKQTTDQIKQSSVITEAVSSGKLKILTVYPDEKMEVWQSHLKNFPSSWINGYDKSLAIRNNQVYDLKAIPTLYLLDVDKTVLLKDASVENIQGFLSQNL